MKQNDSIIFIEPQKCACVESQRHTFKLSHILTTKYFHSDISVNNFFFCHPHKRRMLNTWWLWHSIDFRVIAMPIVCKCPVEMWNRSYRPPFYPAIHPICVARLSYSQKVEYLKWFFCHSIFNRNEQKDEESLYVCILAAFLQFANVDAFRVSNRKKK